MCGGKLWRFIPDSINSMTAAWNTVSVLHRHALPLPETIVDIGANQSQMTRLLRMATPTDVRIISFEPNPSVHPDGEVHRIALSDRDCVGQLVVPHGETGWGTIVTKASHADAAGVPVQVRRFDSLVRDREVDVARWKRPVLLKIDTEGSEYAVLAGFGNELEQVDYLLIEVENSDDRGGRYSLTDVASSLKSYGFDKAIIVASGFNGPNLPPYSDILFWRSR